MVDVVALVVVVVVVVAFAVPFDVVVDFFDADIR